MATINMHMKFEIEIPKQTWLMLRKPCRLQTDGQTDRRTDGRTRWIQYTPPPTSLDKYLSLQVTFPGKCFFCLGKAKWYHVLIKNIKQDITGVIAWWWKINNITGCEFHRVVQVNAIYWSFVYCICYKMYGLSKQGPDSIKRCHLTSIGNPIVEIRRPYDLLISTIGFPIPVRRHLCIELGPSMPQCHLILPVMVLFGTHSSSQVSTVYPMICLYCFPFSFVIIFLMWFTYSYHSGLLHWHWHNCIITPVSGYIMFFGCKQLLISSGTVDNRIYAASNINLSNELHCRSVNMDKSSTNLQSCYMFCKNHDGI